MCALHGNGEVDCIIDWRDTMAERSKAGTSLRAWVRIPLVSAFISPFYLDDHALLASQLVVEVKHKSALITCSRSLQKRSS